MSFFQLQSDSEQSTALTMRMVRHAITDFLVLIVLLGVVNFLTTSGDPGWLSLNPTPFLLVPALIGVRYGFTPGLASGLLTAALIMGTRQLSIADGIAGHRFALTALPVLGLIVGQVAESLRLRNIRQELRNNDLDSENHQLSAERQLLFLAKQDLQQRLGLYGANSASLDQDLAEIASSGHDSATDALLASLARLTHIRSAAVYQVTGARSSTLQRTAITGNAVHFPESLRSDDHHLIHEAIEQRCFLTQKGLLKAVPSRDPGYLLASPILSTDGEVTFLLVIQDLPFNEISRRNFSTIKSICDWFAAFVVNPVSSPARHKAISQTDFYKAIETAITTHTEHALPSTLVRIPFNAAPTAEMTGAFNEFLEKIPGPALLTNASENNQRSLLFLFPAVSNSQVADRFQTALGDFAQRLGVATPPEPRILPTTPGDTPQHLWGQLVSSN